MKTNFIRCITFALCLILVACGPQATPASTATPAPTAKPTSNPRTPLTPETVVPLAERLLATINIDKHPLSDPQMIGNYPEEMVFVQGYIWVRTTNGHLVQVDPATNAIVSAVKVELTPHDPNWYCQGLGTDGKDIWSCAARGGEDDHTIDVVRVDSATQSIVQTFEVNKIYDQDNLVFLGNQIWVLTGKGDQLVGINVTTNEIAPALDLGVRCSQLAAINGSVYATCGYDNVVLQIDPAKKEVSRRIDIEGAVFIDGNESDLWIVAHNSLVRLDAKTLAPIAEFGPVGSVPYILVTDDAVWLNQDGGFVFRIDPASNKVVEQIERSDFAYGYALVVAADSLWVTDTEGYLLYRLGLR